jgi:probable F420-dependent oxidoreductase
MHIGLSRPPTPPPPLPDVDAAHIAKIAEKLGFESIFYGEHPITPVDGERQSVHSHGVPFFQDTLVALARMSAATSTIRIGSGVFLLPLHQPVMLAKQLASLDFYSGGRLILGIGFGWSRIECEAMGGNFDRRFGQAREAVEVMKRMWSRDVASFEGEFYKIAPVMMAPKPLQKPWPPVLLPGPALHDGGLPDAERHRASFQRIVDYADGWIPGFVGTASMEGGLAVITEGRKILAGLCAEKGRDPAELQTTVLLRTEVHDGDTAWPELASRDLIRRYEDLAVERVIVTIPTVTSEDHAREVLERMAEHLL